MHVICICFMVKTNKTFILQTLDPNADENHENLSTNVKKSTVSIENETDPTIGIHDDLNTEVNAIKEENNTKSDQKIANGTAFNDSIHDIEQVWNDFNNYQSRNYSHYEKKNNNVSLGDNPVKTPEAVVLIINSGIINDLLINSKDNNEIIKINDNRISSINATEIKVTNIQSYNDTINDLVKSSIERIVRNLLEDTSSNFNYKHVFLLLNSGNITNVRINTDTLNNSTTNINLKDTLKKHLNGIDITEPIIVDNLKNNSDLTSKVTEE